MGWNRTGKQNHGGHKWHGLAKGDALLREGRYVARVVDGKVNLYGR